MVPKHGLINPHRVYKACEYLIKNHPDYQNITLENYEDWVLKCPTLFDETEKSEEEDNQNSSDEESADTSGGNNSEINEKSQQEAEDNNFNAITCLYPKEPAQDMISNHSNKTKQIKFKRKAKKIFDLAPGQGKIPTNWIREKNHDVIAFPELYPEGKGGVDAERQVKLSRTDFYSTKFLNNNKMYSQNSDYLFVAQQHLERHLLENQISISGQKGKVSKSADGTTKISCKNAFDVFGKIAGTPQYWKDYRNELFARMEQLGPFTFFFTLSAAEMKWSEVTTAILHSNKMIDKIVYQQGWEEDISKIKMFFVGWKTGPTCEYVLSLDKYEERQKHKFYKDHFLLITRMFDNRVKAFISNILMANKDVENYSYRQVETLVHNITPRWQCPKVQLSFLT